MTIDREELRALRRLHELELQNGPSPFLATLRDAVPRLLDELDAKDRRIAELEKQNDRFVSILSATETAESMADTVDLLAAARNRIAELESVCESGRSEVVVAHDAQVARIAELEAEAAKESEATHQLAEEHEKQGMDLAFHRRGHNDALAAIDDLDLRLSIATELNVNDRKRIAELEAGLREALDLYDAAECVGPTRNEIERIAELRKLLPSEET